MTTNDTSLARPQLQHMPAAAIALAILLHVAAVAALWWVSPRAIAEPEQEPIMVSFDSAPSNAGLQAETKPGPPAESLASPPPSTESQRRERQQALAAPPASPTPRQAQPAPSFPLFEFAVPPATEPLPPPTSRDFVKPARPPTRPVQRALPQPRQPPAARRPPSDAPATLPSPLPGPSPGDVIAGQGRQRNDYLSLVFRHLEPYRVAARTGNTSRQSGRVVSRVTLARDGRLIEVSIDTSSGQPAVDAAELAAIRQASPFPPVPRGMPGDPVILVLPMNY